MPYKVSIGVAQMLKFNMSDCWLTAGAIVSAIGFFGLHEAHAWTSGLEYTNQPGLAAIKVYTGDANNPSAYDQGYFGKGIRIGVSDGGINPSHVEFLGAIAAGFDALTGKSGTTNF